MPIFRFEKLVRDGLIEIYKEFGQVAVFVRLEGEAKRDALVKKWQEEKDELPKFDGAQETVIEELADLWQIKRDLLESSGMDFSDKMQEITAHYPGVKQADLEQRAAEKFAKKGGFTGGAFRGFRSGGFFKGRENEFRKRGFDGQ